MGDMIDRDAAIQAVFDWEQGKISGTIADAIAALPAASSEDVRAALAIVNKYAEAWADRDINGSSIRVIADEIAKLKPAEDVRAGALADGVERMQVFRAGKAMGREEALKEAAAIIGKHKHHWEDAQQHVLALILGAKP